MGDIVVTVVGARETSAAFVASMNRAIDNLRQFVKGEQALLEATLRATIQHIVYDAYQPTEYKRTGTLVDAVSSAYFEQAGGQQITLVFYNDPDKVSLKDDPISAGGSHKEDVALEIEEGRYPAGRGGQGWRGPTAPRPAFMLFGRAIQPGIHAGVLDAIARALR